MINLNLVEYPELVEDYTSFGRHYTTPEGTRYPSMTTVLGQQPKPGLDAWRERLGDEKADRVMKASSKLGSEFHDVCEQYVRGNEIPPMTHGCDMLFKRVKGELNNIDDVRGIEIPMWSDILKVAGRSDLIAGWKGVPSIIDYKNSRNEKPRHFCHDYFLQGAGYSTMFYERHGILVKQIVIIIAVWGRPKPTIYVEQVKDWLPKLKQVMVDHNPMWS